MIEPKEKIDSLETVFQQMIQTVNSYLTRDYTITSGRRDPAANAAVGGVRDSAHEAGLAVDVAHDRDIIKAMRLAYALGRAGVVRVGFYDGHLHFDCDVSKPQTQWEGISH